MEYPQRQTYAGHKKKKKIKKFKRTEVIQNIFSDHKGITLEINNKSISGKFPNIWKLKITFE